MKEKIQKLWASVKAWASQNSKAIGSAVGALASFVFVNLTGHDIDAAAKGVIILVVTAAVTWLFPPNTAKE
jgi:hypothetical protein